VQEIYSKMQMFLDAWAVGRDHLKVLEAGCGSASYIHFGPNAFLVGIDISDKQLQRNKELDEKIVGDIQRYDFSPSIFDIIICWNVLEHLSEPEMALKRFAAAVKPNGLIILALPNVYSLKGLITKFTPLQFHIWVYPYLFGRLREWGKDDIGPFKTYLRLSIAPKQLKSFADQHGLRIVFFETRDFLPVLNKKRKLVYHTYKALNWLIGLGQYIDSEIIMILQKETKARTR
jgi:SAM-dependent methyltransferase